MLFFVLTSRCLPVTLAASMGAVSLLCSSMVWSLAALSGFFLDLLMMGGLGLVVIAHKQTQNVSVHESELSKINMHVGCEKQGSL